VSKCKTAPDRIRAAEREKQATAMRLAGATYRQIGERLGISEAGAWQAVRRALERTRKTTADEAEHLRAIECERIDAMLLAVWPQASKGHLGAVATVVKLMARRAMLLGLDAPQRQEMTGADGAPLMFSWSTALRLHNDDGDDDPDA